VDWNLVYHWVVLVYAADGLLTVYWELGAWVGVVHYQWDALM
jgi:hypothetical protein